MNERKTIHRIHFIGIGGIGMSGLAEVLHQQGYVISGSDARRNDQTDHLAAEGVRIMIGHDALNVQGDLVVYTPAIGDDNPELRAAKEQHIPVVKRAELLGDLLRSKQAIAVAGTHGKTTTTGMIATILETADLHPSIFVGGVLHAMKTNAKWGDGAWAVVEADEYDRSFHELHPHYAVLNNVESDHLDCYDDVQDIYGAFVTFVNQTSAFGRVFVNASDTGVQAVLPHIRRPIRTYSLTGPADVRAIDLRVDTTNMMFNVELQGTTIRELVIHCVGEHNVSNALAAIAVAWEMGLDAEQIRTGLDAFRGTGRRFEILGEHQGVLFVDDYAHHPTEIRATLRAAKAGWSDRRIVAVFQPHLYSRTRDYQTEFGLAFEDADAVLVTEIYAAREKPIPGIDGEMLAKEIRKHHADVRWIPERDTLGSAIQESMREGDLVITLGAGDVTHVGRELVKKLT